MRDLPAFKGLKLQGAEVAGEKTPWGWTAEFKLPWANFPNFKAKAGEVIGIDCELCSSDGGPRVDRTFVYSSPANVATPSAFGRVKLVDKIDLGESQSRSAECLLPMSLTKSANYAWLYGTVGISPTIDKSVAKIEGKLLDGKGKVRKTTNGSRKTLDGSGFVLWTGSWELFDLPPGIYTVEVAALDKAGRWSRQGRRRYCMGTWQRQSCQTLMALYSDLCPAEWKTTLMQLITVKIEKPDDTNFILGQTHFIKSVEDIHEALVGAVPGIKFGLAFCEASGKCLVRWSGTDAAMIELAKKNAAAIGAGHSFIVFLGDGFYPLNVLNTLKMVPEVCRIFCATANPTEVVLAETEQGRGILGVVDGFSPKGVEDEGEIKWRKDFLRQIGYKL